MIKQLLNSSIAKYRGLSVARRSIICLCLRHRQIIDLLTTDKSRYFAQSRPIIVYYCLNSKRYPIAPTLKRDSREKPYVSTFLSQIVHRWCILQIHTITALFTNTEKGRGGGGDCNTNNEQE